MGHSIPQWRDSWKLPPGTAEGRRQRQERQGNSGRQNLLAHLIV